MRALEDGPHDVAIMRTIIDLACTLGLTVVVEGVETEAQLRLLHGTRCHEMQGYLFSRPVPPASCVQLMRAGAGLSPALLSRARPVTSLRSRWAPGC